MPSVVPSIRVLGRFALLPWRVDWKRSSLQLFARLLNASAGILVALWLKYLADGAVTGNLRVVLVASLALGATIAIGSGFNGVTEMVGIDMRERIEQELELGEMRIAAGLPGLAHLEHPEFLDKLKLLQEDQMLLTQSGFTVINLFVLAVQLVGTGLLLSRVAPQLLLLPVLALPSLLTSNLMNRHLRKVEEATAEQSRLEQWLHGCAGWTRDGREIRIYGLRDLISGRASRLWDEVARRRLRAQFLASGLNAFAWLIFAFGYLGAIWIVVNQAIHHRSTVGDILLVISLAGQVHSQVGGAVNLFTVILTDLRALGRYIWLLDYAGSHGPLPSEAVAMPAGLSQGIRFENVSFVYPGTAEPVLRNVTLELPARSTNALVGENGAGKTTLVKLLARFYEPTEGRILLDGVDIRRFPIEEWRSVIAGVFQDYQSLQFRLRESVGLGALAHIDDAAAVGGALERASAGDLSAELPEGLETELGTWFGGTELSGGQWQKVALGRGMMREQPLVLLLDEPTSALDAQSEHALFEHYRSQGRRLAGLNGGITLLVSHRFSTVRMADRIVVVDKGGVVESGTHRELMSRPGLYSELFTLQAAAYAAPVGNGRHGPPRST